MPKRSPKPRKPTQRQRDLVTEWLVAKPRIVTLVGVGTDYELVDLETAAAIRTVVMGWCVEK
jgi:hypothetical protein